MVKQNINAFKEGLSMLGCTNIQCFENGIEFTFEGEVRKETYQQCMVYILNGL